MTRNASMNQLFAEHKPSLMRALSLLQPHHEAIRTEWRKKLGRAGMIAREIDAFSHLTIDAQSELLNAGDFDEFRRELEAQALLLETRGISEAQVAIALGLYLECCMPHLFAAGGHGREPAMAVIQLIALMEWGLLRRFAAYRETAVRRVQERERHSLSRDLHDDIGHNLLVLKLYLEMMTMDLSKGDVAHIGSKLQEAMALVSYAVDSVRRLMLDLGPAMLSQFGFLRAIRIYSRQFSLRTGIEVKVEASGVPEKLPAGHETALYRVVQGALSNVLQHAQAKHVRLNIHTTKQLLMMSIEDDGRGFEVGATLPQRAFGLMAMRERVELLGGKFHIASSPTRAGSRRHGTRIEIDLPFDHEDLPTGSRREVGY
jgi:signal transduction histidine kinase